MRHDGNGRVGADQLAHAARIHHDVFAGLEVPVREQRLEHGRRRTRLLGRINEHHQVPTLAEKPLQHVGFRLQQVGLRSGDDDDRGVGRHVGRLREDGLGDLVIVALERPFGATESIALGAVDVAFTVALDEVDLLLASVSPFTSPLVRSCSSDEVTRSVLPLYSMTTVP